MVHLTVGSAQAVPATRGTDPAGPAGAQVEPPGRLLVFRALVLGDLLCATPALRALRHAWPGAQIALLGLPWAREWVARLGSVDEFIAFPGWPGLPERPLADPRAMPRLMADLRARRFDLALQMHGSGGTVNPLVAAFGARRNAGFTSPTAWVPAADAALFAAWPDTGTEVERLLRLTDHLGLPRRGNALDFPLTDADRAHADLLLGAEGPPDCGDGVVVVHPGSQLPSRRWPAERFAAVADGLADAGFTVVLTGTPAEAPLTAAVAAAMRAPVRDLSGRTSLWTLGALVESAALVLCNDTGISHVAAAVGTPSVVVSSGGDAARWAPAQASRHTVLWAPMGCRPCAHAVCPTGHGCALAVPVQDVLQVALHSARPPASRLGPAPGRVTRQAREPAAAEASHA